MDFFEWGTEYQKEAEKLREYLRPLKRKLKNVSGQERILLNRRVSMLYEMYLELLHTGKELFERGKRE